MEVSDHSSDSDISEPDEDFDPVTPAKYLELLKKNDLDEAFGISTGDESF